MRQAWSGGYEDRTEDSDINDYYEMQNIQADTDMRRSLSKAEDEKTEKIASQKSEPSPAASKPVPQNSGFGGPSFSSSPFSSSPFSSSSGSAPMNPLAARFASLAAAQKRNNNNNTDGNK